MNKSTEQGGCSVEQTRKILGKDEKFRQPRKPRCEACLTKSRKGQALPDKCSDCTAIKKQAERSKKNGENPDADIPPSDPISHDTFVDELGHAVPEVCQSAFKTLSNFDLMDTHCRALQKLIDDTAKLPGGEQLARFVKATGSGDNIIHKNENLNALKRDLKGTRPYSICPRCKGKGNECKGCDGRGWVSKTTWDSFEDSVKARIA